MLPDAGAVACGRAGRDKAGHSPFGFPDGDCGVARVRADRARARIWFYGPALVISAALIAFPWVLPPAVHLNTALRPLNAVLLVGFARRRRHGGARAFDADGG